MKGVGLLSLLHPSLVIIMVVMMVVVVVVVVVVVTAAAAAARVAAISFFWKMHLPVLMYLEHASVRTQNRHLCPAGCPQMENVLLTKQVLRTKPHRHQVQQPSIQNPRAER
jgi:hypothetical protein